MRWIGLAVLSVLALFAVAIGGLYVYARAVGATVNTPVQGMLAAQFPRVFAAPKADAGRLAGRIHLPPGFAMSVFARGIPGARMLRTTRTGDLVVAVPDEGKVLLLLRDRNGDGESDGRYELLNGLDAPNGLDFHEQYLYVAEQGQIGRVPFDQDTGKVIGAYQVVIPHLPAGGNHYKKTIRFGPDDKLYVSIGSSCNVCLEKDLRRAGMMRFNADGSGGEPLASGLRNSAGFAWRPSDNALFATDNGRDLLGDDFPPCELNQIVHGGFYGWPFVNGAGIPDPDFGKGHEAQARSARAPVFAFKAHNAPLGIVFPRNPHWPVDYQGAALVALHGSWNRSHKDGYKVVSLHWRADGSIQARDFITGFLQDDDVIGRPAELAEGLDGALYVSDDFAGAVYRVAFGERGNEGARGETRAVASDGGVAVALMSAQARSSDDPDQGALVAQGDVLFHKGICLECHSTAAAPGAASASASARIELKQLSAKYDTAKLLAYLTRPKSPMPPVGKDADRQALAAYLLAKFP